MATRGIRGAVVASENTKEAISAATKMLIREIIEANPSLEPADLASAFFTMTPDLNATFPALAARELGWRAVPLLCATEIAVPHSLPRCVRVLIHWNTELPQAEMRHVYLGEAARLRPDLVHENGSL